MGRVKILKDIPTNAPRKRKLGERVWIVKDTVSLFYK